MPKIFILPYLGNYHYKQIHEYLDINEINRLYYREHLFYCSKETNREINQKVSRLKIVTFRPNFEEAAREGNWENLDDFFQNRANQIVIGSLIDEKYDAVLVIAYYANVKKLFDECEKLAFIYNFKIFADDLDNYTKVIDDLFVIENDNEGHCSIKPLKNQFYLNGIFNGVQLNILSTLNDDDYILNRKHDN